MSDTTVITVYRSTSPIQLLDTDLRLIKDKVLYHCEVTVEDTDYPHDDHFFEFFHGSDGSFVAWSLLWKYSSNREFIYTTNHPASIISHVPLRNIYLKVPEQSYEPDFTSMLRLVPPKYREAILTAWKSEHVLEENGVDIDRYNTHIVYGTVKDDTFHVIAKGTPAYIDDQLDDSDEENE